MKKILIIDDDPMMQDLYQMKITRSGYEALQALNSAEALEQISSNAPNMILLDRHLGDENGLELLKQIRLQANTKNTPVFLLSNQDATADDLILLKTLAPAEYLIKEHIDLKVLAEKIETLIGPA